MKMSKFPTRFLILAAFLISNSAQAAIIEINYTGDVVGITGTTNGITAVSGTFSAGDSVAGTVRYDTTTAQTSASSTNAVYEEGIDYFELTIGGYTGYTTGDIFTYNDDLSFKDSAVFYALDYVSGATVGGLNLTRNQLSLTSPIDVFADLDIPSISDMQALWTNNTANGNINFMSFSSGQDFAVVRYSLSGLIVGLYEGDEVAVPAPATLALVVLGLVAMGFARRDALKS